MDRIKLIETFIAVADSGSFTVAADKQGLSAALTSKYVGQLEQHLHIQLFNRTTRSVSLTEIGHSYLEHARQVVENFNALELAIQNKRGTPTGRLIVSAPVTFGEMYLTRTVSQFLEKYPTVDVDLRLADRFVSLADEGIDLAVRIADLPDSSLIARRLAPARVIAVASPAYLDKAGMPYHPDDLRHHNCIVDTNFQNPGEWRFKSSGREISVSISGRFAVNSARATREMILSDAGIGLIPTYAIGDQIKSGHAIPILEQFEITRLGIYAVYLPNRYLAPKVRTFIDFMIEQYGAKPEWDQYD